VPSLCTSLLLPLAVVSTMTRAASSDTPQIVPSAVRWSVPIAARPASPPVIAGTVIVLALQPGTVVAHRVSDGSEVWHVELSADQPVAVDADRVFVAAGEAIHALTAGTGSVLWRTPAGTLTAPLLVHEGWIIAATANELTAYRAADGSKVWSRESGAQRDRAAIEGDNLYVPLQDGRLLALDLLTGGERWVHRFAGAPTEILAFADRIYLGVAEQFFYCLNAANGGTSWHQRTGAALLGRPVSDASRVFVAGLDNVVHAFDRRGHDLWHRGVPYRPTSGPVVIASSVVVPGTEMKFRVFDAASGREKSQIKLDERPAAAPAFGESTGILVMAAVTGSLTGKWELELFGPAPLTIAIEPLTVLPGISVPVLLPPEKQ
jgi:outer membrane protein assembly factor BamB